MKKRKPKPLPELKVIRINGDLITTANGYRWRPTESGFLKDIGSLEQVHHQDEFNWGSFKKPKSGARP